MAARPAPRLVTRFMLAHAVVIAVGAATAYLTVRLLLPPLFDHRMQMGGGLGSMMGGGSRSGASSSTHSALISALNVALLVAVLASAAVAGIVAVFATRRLLRPLNAIRETTRRLAAGDYRSSVALPKEPELAALAADVNSLAEQLAQTESRRIHLLGEVAHEMRTPLTTLDGYVESLIDGVMKAEPENLQVMADELRRLHRLADDLAAISRAEENRLEIRPTWIDLSAVVQRTSARLQPQFDDAGVQLLVAAEGPLPVFADADRIAQILTNLLGNALAATPENGHVRMAAQRRGADALVTVSDDGVGMSEADVTKVFERFYRASTARRRSTGSGVGLTISRGLARAHGGDVTAESRGPGMGASFSLRLPLQDRMD